MDAVILDYLMPEMNGGEVAEEIRRRKPGVPIVMLSACLDVPDPRCPETVLVTQSKLLRAALLANVREGVLEVSRQIGVRAQ